jgi:2-methylcitrate dehydratase PrpD
MTDDPAFALAEHVVRTRYDDLPVSAIDSTRRDVLDTFGCMLGGTGAPGIDVLTAMATEWGGTPQSGVLMRGRRLPAPQAAMLNASMGHALDFDDTLDHGGSIHPGVSILAAALATADRLGGCGGKDFVLAVTLGLDVSCRIALASTVDRGWHRTACIGVFGAAATAGKLMGLSAEQMRHALGIAYSHAAGNRQCIVDGALTKRMQAGQAASAGVVAAELARRDFTGAHNVFNGQFGFFELYQPGGADPSLLTRDLGHAFRGEELSYKPYPCGRPLHATIDAALAGRAALKLTNAADVAEATIAAHPAAHAAYVADGAHKRRPTQVVQAQFALPFLVAAALAHGRVGIAEASRFEDPVVLGLADRIRGEARADKLKGWSSVTVQRTDGRAVTIEATTPLGAPDNPLGQDKLAAKFCDCAANALRPIDPAAAGAAIKLIARLEDVPDVTALPALFA